MAWEGLSPEQTRTQCERTPPPLGPFLAVRCSWLFACTRTQTYHGPCSPDIPDRPNLKSAALCPHSTLVPVRLRLWDWLWKIKVTEAQDTDSVLHRARFCSGHRAAEGVLCAGGASRAGCWRRPPSPGLVPVH